MYLPKQAFSAAIDSVPLVSIDLLIKNFEGKYLLGLRNNKPAQGSWFVPGGRILKNETLDIAFSRLCMEELGVNLHRKKAKFLGPFEHFYSDSVFGDDQSTHYVVLGYEIEIDLNIEALPCEQHRNYKWFTRDEMLTDTSVHKHTKWYID